MSPEGKAGLLSCKIDSIGASVPVLVSAHAGRHHTNLVAVTSHHRITVPPLLKGLLHA